MVSANSMCIIDIPFYSLSTPTKTATTTSYYEGSGVLVDEFWEVKTFMRDMGPITRLDVRDTSYNFQVGTMSLYGIN